MIEIGIDTILLWSVTVTGVFILVARMLTPRPAPPLTINEDRIASLVTAAVIEFVDQQQMLNPTFPIMPNAPHLAFYSDGAGFFLEDKRWQWLIDFVTETVTYGLIDEGVKITPRRKPETSS